MLPAPFQDWTTPLLSDRYDSHLLPVGKRGLLIGMGMTEKQGGFRCRATPPAQERLDDGSYRLVGHKWFSQCRKAMRIWCWHRPRAVCPAFIAARFFA